MSKQEATMLVSVVVLLYIETVLERVDIKLFYGISRPFDADYVHLNKYIVNKEVKHLIILSLLYWFREIVFSFNIIKK